MAGRAHTELSHAKCDHKRPPVGQDRRRERGHRIATERRLTAHSNSILNCRLLRTMKITDIEAIHLRVEDPNIGLFDGSYDDCVIRVRTDAGITGIGEVESLAPAIQGIVNAPPAHNHARGLRELLLGEDPTDPERLWQAMYEGTDYIGRRGLMMHAIGGVDIALWDIAGQAQGKPICELLGGAKRDRLLAYGTIYPMARAPEEVRAQIAEARQTNLRAFKFAADPWWMDDIALTARLLHAAREEAGPDAILIV